MESYQPLDDVQKKFQGKLAGIRGGGFAEVIHPQRKKFAPNLSKKKKVRIYNRALLVAEIVGLYSGGR